MNKRAIWIVACALMGLLLVVSGLDASTRPEQQQPQTYQLER